MFDLYGTLPIAVHSGSDHVGMAGIINALLSSLETLLTLPSNQLFSALFPGIAAMENLHPLVVHFPLALLMLFFLADVAGSLLKNNAWRAVADWFLYAGTAFAGLAVLVGWLASTTVVHGEEVHDIMETHMRLGITSMFLALSLSVWRLSAKNLLVGVTNALYLFFSGLLCLILIFTADLGGLMVYKYGVAVEPVRIQQGAEMSEHHHEHNHDHEHGE